MKYYLLIKTIESKGIKYLCKCIESKDPIRYKGSGVEWKQLLKENQDSVIITEIVGLYDKEEFRIVGKQFSIHHDIVNDPMWANKVSEGGNGGPTITGMVYGHCHKTLKVKIFKNYHTIPKGWLKGRPNAKINKTI